jgi:hypothetical protein
MRRREFITLPGAKTTWPVAGREQPLERARILSLLTDSQNAWSSSVTKIADPRRRRDRVRGRECPQLIQCEREVVWSLMVGYMALFIAYREALGSPTKSKTTRCASICGWINV